MIKIHSTYGAFVSYVLGTALLLVLSGCSGRASTADSSIPDSLGATSEETIITFAGSEYQRQYFELLMETFHEQNPDITVQFVDLFQFFSGEEGYNPVTTFRKLAEAADTVLIQAPFPWDKSMDLSRYFRNVQPLYEADPSFQPDDFWPGILHACEDAYGNVVGLPLTASVNGIFYDKAPFDAAGVPYPHPGWTWDDFQNAVVALAEEKGGDIKYGFYDQTGMETSILAPLLKRHLQVHGGEVDADELLQEVQWYIDLAQAGKLSGVKLEEESTYEVWDQLMRLFQDDALRPAMWSDSLISWVPTLEMTQEDTNPFSGMSIDRFDFAPYPVFANGPAAPTNRSEVECVAMSAGSNNPRAAWLWMDFLSRQWMVIDKTQVYELSHAPSRKSASDTDGYWDLLPEKAVPAIRYALEHGLYDFAYIPSFHEIHIALVKAIREKADFAQVLESAIAARPAVPTNPVDDAPIVVATPRSPLAEGVTAFEYYTDSYNIEEHNNLKALVEQFNLRSSDIQVVWRTDFQGSQQEDWITSMANNFDCFTASVWGILPTESLQNLNALMSSEPAAFSSDFIPEMADKFRTEGNLYALPAARRTQMMAYNADLLARRGLPIPANDWTFEDFIGMAMAAASTSEADPSYGFLYAPYDSFLSLGRDIQWFDLKANPPNVSFDSPDVRGHLQWLTNLEQERVLLNQEGDWETVHTIMSSGQVAFWMAIMGEESSWIDGSGQQSTFKIAMAPMPRVPGNNPISYWSEDRGHFISAQAEDPRACWEWIKFLSEQPSLFNGVPGRRSVLESTAWEATVGKEEAAAYRVVIEKAQPSDPVETDVWEDYALSALTEWQYQAIRAALEGQELRSVLITQQQKAETYLDCLLVQDSNKPTGELEEEFLTCRQLVDPQT